MDLTHHFLIAMPLLEEEHFRRSLVYVLDHGEHGAFGVVVNHALGMPLGEVLAQLEIVTDDPVINATGVLRGGPVDPGHGLVLHPPGPNFESTRDFAGGVSLSSSRDVLEALAAGDEPSIYLVLLGHAGWAPGQLESEVADNAWLSCEAETPVLFDTPLERRREAAGRLMGFDPDRMSPEAGHA